MSLEEFIVRLVVNGMAVGAIAWGVSLMGTASDGVEDDGEWFTVGLVMAVIGALVILVQIVGLVVRR